MITHMMKERRQGFEVAKCGVEVKSNKLAPMTIWHTMVTCPDCLAAMAADRTNSLARGGC